MNDIPKLRYVASICSDENFLSVQGLCDEGEVYLAMKTGNKPETTRAVLWPFDYSHLRGAFINEFGWNNYLKEIEKYVFNIISRCSVKPEVLIG